MNDVQYTSIPINNYERMYVYWLRVRIKVIERIDKALYNTHYMHSRNRSYVYWYVEYMYVFLFSVVYIRSRSVYCMIW